MKVANFVTNTSIALMRIKDLSNFNGIPIIIHFSDEFIHIIVGFDMCISDILDKVNIIKMEYSNA